MKSITKLPNLFVVGAPKCGTTSLCYYLEQHPSIYMSKPKEPYFFGRDISKKSMSPQDYLNLFEPGLHHTYRGEGSTWYLFSRTAAEEIKAFNPAAKIIAIIRNPVELLPSLLEQRLYDRTENVTTLSEALALEPARKRGEMLPPGPRKLPKEEYMYSEVPMFAAQIQRYYYAFGKNNVLILRFEHLKMDPSEVMKSVECFLQLRPFSQYEFTPQNERKVLKFGWLKDMMISRPMLPRQIHAIMNLVSSPETRKRLLDKVERINRVAGGDRRVDDKLRNALIAQFKHQEKELEQLLGENFDGFVN